MAEWNSCVRDYLSHKVKNIYCLALYQKTLSTLVEDESGKKKGRDVYTVCYIWVVGNILQRNIDISTNIKEKGVIMGEETGN